MSKLIETKREFQDLAVVRLAEAKALLGLGLWDGAYYLSGYAVELALKACIIKCLMATDAFPEKDFSKECYTHKLESLVKVAKLETARQIVMNADPVFERNWGLARDWSEQTRYHRIDQVESESLYNSIADAEHGVLPWIKTQW